MKKTVTGFILFAAGVAFLLFGFFFAGGSGSREADLRIALSEVENLTDDRVGQTVKLKLTEEQQYMDNNNYLAFCMNGERTTMLRIRVGDDLAGKYKRLVENGISVIGTVELGTDEITQQSFDAAVAYYEMMAEFGGNEVTDELKEDIRKTISPYYIEVTAADAIMDPGEVFMLRLTAFASGGILILMAAAVLISKLTDKPVWKIALMFVGILLVPVVIGAVLLFPKLKTATQIRRDGEGIYYLEYTDKLKFDDMLTANITTDDELIDWISKAEFFGLPIDVDINRYGCASFSAKSPEGGVLFGRNFDYGETDTLIVHSKPKDGHEFYGVADLYVMGIGRDEGCLDPDSLPGKFLMLASPYIVCDGINDAGLGVSTHELSLDETHQDTGKPDLFVYSAVSLLLDRCANVDEALELLGSCDIHSHNGSMQHLFVVDKTGRSVVVEWLDNKMYVNELNACTNSVLTPGEYYDLGKDWRLPVIGAGLAEHKNILTKEQAKELLDAASQENTEWSCVYDLDNFSVDVYLDEDYERGYRYGDQDHKLEVRP